MHSQMMSGGGYMAFTISRRTMIVFAVVVVAGLVLQLLAPDYVDLLRSYWWHIVLGAAAVSMLWTIVQVRLETSRQEREHPKMFNPMPFSVEDLSWYDGVRNSTAARIARGENNENAQQKQKQRQHPLPEFDNLVFVGVKNVVYNVSPEYYGPGAGYHVFAAKDSSRQLGKVVVSDEECNADWTTLGASELKTLDDWEARFRSKYCIAGWVRVAGEAGADEWFERGRTFAPSRRM